MQQQQQQPYADQNYQQQGMYGAGPYAPMNPAQSAMPNVPPTSGTPTPQNYQQPPAANQLNNYQNFQTGPPAQQNQQFVQPQQQATQPPIQQARVATPKAKLPLPEEFIYLQTVLEELKTQCINSASNPVSL